MPIITSITRSGRHPRHSQRERTRVRRVSPVSGSPTRRLVAPPASSSPPSGFAPKLEQVLLHTFQLFARLLELIAQRVRELLVQVGIATQGSSPVPGVNAHPVVADAAGQPQPVHGRA